MDSKFKSILELSGSRPIQCIRMLFRGSVAAAAKSNKALGRAPILYGIRIRSRHVSHTCQNEYMMTILLDDLRDVASHIVTLRPAPGRPWLRLRIDH